MNLKRLRKEFGPSVEVNRDRKKRVVTASAAGLSYSAQESAFTSERDLAEHLRSKVPVMRVGV